MQIKNTETHFGLVAILFHWIMAALIIGLLAVGLYMVNLPVSSDKYKLYDMHKAFGILVLGLIILRTLWRLVNTTPKLDIPWHEKIAARCAHFGLYGLMFAMPLSGWSTSSAAGYPPSFFGLFTLPNLIQPNKHLSAFFGSTHQWLAYCLIALICIHVLAALKHHFYDKDDILKRMIS